LKIPGKEIETTVGLGTKYGYCEGSSRPFCTPVDWYLLETMLLLPNGSTNAMCAGHPITPIMSKLVDVIGA